jgi:stringent starvation protein A
MAVANKKPVMTLYSGSEDVYSHRVRLALAEKGLLVNLVEVDQHESPEDLLEINPYNDVPTLVDRNLVLYHPQIVMEYLDERFPHPPLFPVYPIARARMRLMIHRIDEDWYSLVDKILESPEKEAEMARKELLEGLISMLPVFKQTAYFMSDDFSMVDCAIAPLLWRLPMYGIELPKTARPIYAYAQRVFDRPAFYESLTETEREIRMEIDD